MRISKSYSWERGKYEVGQEDNHVSRLSFREHVVGVYKIVLIILPRQVTEQEPEQTREVTDAKNVGEQRERLDTVPYCNDQANVVVICGDIVRHFIVSIDNVLYFLLLSCFNGLDDFLFVYCLKPLSQSKELDYVDDSQLFRVYARF